MLLSLVITLVVRQADSASLEHLHKDPVQHQSPHHAALLPRQQPACINLLDATELHGEWVEGASNLKASRLPMLHPSPDGSACRAIGLLLSYTMP